MTNYGPLNAHAVGVLLKEMVRRAIETIQAQQFSFETDVKEGLFGRKTDVVTTADQAAQEVYLGMIRECLPGVGIIAEEDQLRVPCTLEDEDLWVTVDPLDGTRAFTRRQSSGIGTMIAMIRGREVISAYVGDVMTREIYGYRPESPKVHRISQYNIGMRLVVDEDLALSHQFLLLRSEPRRFCETSKALFLPPDSRVFKSFEITSGSVGIQFSRLWKGEVGGILVRPGHFTPWDITPLLGISQKLGFQFLAVEEGTFTPLDLAPSLEFLELEHETLIVHESRIDELTHS